MSIKFGLLLTAAALCAARATASSGTPDSASVTSPIAPPGPAACDAEPPPPYGNAPTRIECHPGLVTQGPAGVWAHNPVLHAWLASLGTVDSVVEFGSGSPSPHLARTLLLALPPTATPRTVVMSRAGQAAASRLAFPAHPHPSPLPAAVLWDAHTIQELMNGLRKANVTGISWGRPLILHSHGAACVTTGPSCAVSQLQQATAAFGALSGSLFLFAVRPSQLLDFARAIVAAAGATPVKNTHTDTQADTLKPDVSVACDVVWTVALPHPSRMFADNVWIGVTLSSGPAACTHFNVQVALEWWGAGGDSQLAASAFPTVTSLFGVEAAFAAERAQRNTHTFRQQAGLPCDLSRFPGYWAVPPCPCEECACCGDPYELPSSFLSHRVAWEFIDTQCGGLGYVEGIRARNVPGHPAPPGPSVEWLANKVILLIGDSFDRNMVTSVCDAVNGTLHVTSAACQSSNEDGKQRTFESPFCGGMPLHCWFVSSWGTVVPGLNLHLVVGFLLGTSELHQSLIAKHIDPMRTFEENLQAVQAKDRIKQLQDFLIASGLEPDAVVASSIHWDLLQRFNSFAEGYITGSHIPPVPFSPAWVRDTYLPALQEQVVAEVAASFPSAWSLSLRTAPPVNESRVVKAVGYSGKLPYKFKNFDNHKVGVLNAAIRHAAAVSGFGTVDFSAVMSGQERYLDADGYHWPRHMNLRMAEVLLSLIHNKYVAL